MTINSFDNAMDWNPTIIPSHITFFCLFFTKLTLLGCIYFTWISTRQPKWSKIGLFRFMTMARQVRCFRKSCRRFKLHPLLFKLHLNFDVPLWGQIPWPIYTFKVFCFLFIVWNDANKCSNNVWLCCASSTSYVQSWWISCSISTFDV